MIRAALVVGAALTTALMPTQGSGPSLLSPRPLRAAHLTRARPLEPLLTVSPKYRHMLACVRNHESRNKLVDTNPSTDAEGLYQFIPYIWQYARTYIHGLPAKPNQATRYQQDEVAVFYINRNHGLYPEWQDGC